jgi:hypothetical protein
MNASSFPSAGAVNTSTSSPAASVASSSVAASGVSRASVQAAAQGRDVPAPPAPDAPLSQRPEASDKPADGGRPKQDLDDLARQIYAILKRRLVTERRRQP